MKTVQVIEALAGSIMIRRCRLNGESKGIEIFSTAIR